MNGGGGNSVVDGVVVKPSVEGVEDYAVKIESLQFKFPGREEPIISNFSLKLPHGSRCILVGENGAGKTTLLQLIAGQYMVDRNTIRILGRPAFHDTSLLCSGDMSYLGTAWRRDIAFAGYGVSLQGDFSAGQMIRGVKGVDPERREKLIKLLGIDESWRMMRVSDGQRRRVQICLGLLKPYKVLLLDEITVDLDIVGRLALLEFLEEECEQRKCTIIYATHIFDGIEPWFTHFAYLENGELKRGGEASTFTELKDRKLLHVIEDWLRKIRDERRKNKVKNPDVRSRPSATKMNLAFGNRHMAFYR
ncbi:P-loop-containing nucleoside triphosphate hydrolase [Chloropicon primus]|uniref:P-loop-containing nucleoside triphosphate hydrolase n=1 Tax=Chloropicon primus TaxID=1764295 RepID=A0A5B8MYE2_9CHLO|nr:P-loop-containing nucleoside triphosphate hydrolase [Chloropicon primus]UPR04830.1 P-loop-containing nucleoside triphosphate hydrolase [Chloropicon primus]|mmetsp:Transcript_13730/g.38685  ORF Transcript_13730/g.38685 Transcript_13730/m.38685 type:complete len:306 (-) Transcript_13730:214-1131(-)|eukprot:QDZ25633.1 P-loop-containing nucleoside triphosphate hydrolase [Chloropicon primus]